MNNSDVEALTSFVEDNVDLERIEILLNRFNLFESLDIVRQEIRHSAFLRWFLDPSETHGLGDFPLRQFLRRTLRKQEGSSEFLVSLLDLHDWDLSQVQVLKERHRIDILVLDERKKFVCAIENKIDSGEGPEQLKRYKKTVEQTYGEYKPVFVYLTKFGDRPSHEAYIPMSYKDITSIVEDTLERRESQTNNEIKLFLQQYLEMIGRHIVEDSCIQEICRRIYRNHRRALDLIFVNMQDRAAEVAEAIRTHVESRDDLMLLSGSKTYMSILPRRLNLPSIQDDEGTAMLTWRIVNKDERVRFRLELGPGPGKVREQIFQKANSSPRVFGKPKADLSPSYHTFFSEDWISRKDYNEQDDEGIGRLVGKRIDSLWNSKGEALEAALMELAHE